MRVNFSEIESYYDIILVGSGVCSITFLNRLFERKYTARILVVEAGTMLSGKKYPSNFSVSSSGIFIKPTSRFFGVGGGSNVWGPLHGLYCAENLDEKYRCGEFPFNAVDYQKYIDISSEKFGTPPWREFDNLKGIDEDIHLRSFVRNKNKFSFYKFSSVLEASCVDFVENCYACKLSSHQEGEGLELKSGLTGEIKNVIGKSIVLAAGTLENIRILKKSEFSQCNEIGHYFMSHPKGLVGSFKSKSLINDELFEFKENSYIKYFGLFNGVKSPGSSYLRLRRGIYFRSIYKILYKLSDYINSNKSLIIRLISKILYKLLQFINKIVLHVTFSNYVSIEVFASISPIKENKLWINEFDELCVNHCISEQEVKSIFKLIDLTVNKLNLISREQITFESLKNDISRDGSHHLGGSRGTDGRLLVDGQTMKLSGSKSTFVLGGASISFPDVVNPTLTFVTMALYLADQFLSDTDNEA